MNRLPAFAYASPHSLAEAIDILQREGSAAIPYAGGTDLLVRGKRRGELPRVLVNLKRIGELAGIQQCSSGLRLGALTTIAEMQSLPLINERYPVLAQTAARLGPPTIRSLATLGGNIGRASPASDMAPALIALSATVAVAGPQGSRVVALEHLFRGPGVTVLAPGEIITSFLVPALPEHAAAVYERLGRTAGAECALVGVACCLTLTANGKSISAARVALASVAPVPLRAQQAEAVLLAGSPTEFQLELAAQAAAAECMPISDVRASAAYRREMVRVLTLRALRKALAMARGVQA